MYRVFLLFIAIAATIPKNASSKRNYFIINPTFGKKILVIFPYLAVTVLIGFTLKEQTSSSTLIMGNCIAFVFVLIRHTIVRMQNKDLTETLKVFNNQLEQTVSQRTMDLINKSNDLVKNQERFKSLYEYHPDPILTIDSNGTVLNINQAGSMLLGKDSAVLIGKECFSIF